MGLFVWLVGNGWWSMADGQWLMVNDWWSMTGSIRLDAIIQERDFCGLAGKGGE